MYNELLRPYKEVETLICKVRAPPATPASPVVVLDALPTPVTLTFWPTLGCVKSRQW